MNLSKFILKILNIMIALLMKLLIVSDNMNLRFHRSSLCLFSSTHLRYRNGCPGCQFYILHCVTFNMVYLLFKSADLSADNTGGEFEFIFAQKSLVSSTKSSCSMHPYIYIYIYLFAHIYKIKIRRPDKFLFVYVQREKTNHLS